VAELVYAHDLKSCLERDAGSIPAPGTMERKTKKNSSQNKIANFLYEIGTMRKLMRIHRQVLLTDDASDSIASHSYRVAIISWFLAKIEGADPYKTVMMSLLHDMAEVRSNDHNWVHKKYVKIFEDEINAEQLGTLPYPDLIGFMTEYEKRESKESILAKEADTLDQILLLREYDWAGNKEAGLWLYGEGKKKSKNQFKKIKTETGRKLAEAIYEVNPSDWWKNLYTSENRK
jgi:putative hydrolase of HD superfamily